jgi:hypothetical protein
LSPFFRNRFFVIIVPLFAHLSTSIFTLTALNRGSR